MDEIFGYFPPTANPPSKQPMLTLLKQARAFGLGCVLATQNPVDLDYKGLANCGTWFIGRLQTERDKLRVLEGLEGARWPAAKTARDLEGMMSGLTQRVFLMRNVHDDAPVLLQTRWALSYLRGPLTGPEIARVMAARKSAAPRQRRRRGRRSRATTGAASRAPTRGRRHRRVFPAARRAARARCSTSPWSRASRSCTTSMRSSAWMTGRPQDGWRRWMTAAAMPPGKTPARDAPAQVAAHRGAGRRRAVRRVARRRIARRQLPGLGQEPAGASLRDRARQRLLQRCAQGRLETRRVRGRFPRAARRSPCARSAMRRWPSCASAGRTNY